MFFDIPTSSVRLFFVGLCFALLYMLYCSSLFSLTLFAIYFLFFRSFSLLEVVVTAAVVVVGIQSQCILSTVVLFGILNFAICCLHAVAFALTWFFIVPHSRTLNLFIAPESIQTQYCDTTIGIDCAERHIERLHSFYSSSWWLLLLSRRRRRRRHLCVFVWKNHFRCK